VVLFLLKALAGNRRILASRLSKLYTAPSSKQTELLGKLASSSRWAIATLALRHDSVIAQRDQLKARSLPRHLPQG
jgi:hypothetical protein